MKQGMRQGQNTVHQEILHFEKVSFLVIRTRTGIKKQSKGHFFKNARPHNIEKG